MLVHQRSSGLLLAEEAAAPRLLRHALKQLDPELVLGCDPDEQWGCFVWRVFRRDGDRPAVWLFDWREDFADPRSAPRPLSHALVEEAAARRLDSRRPHPVDPLEANDRLVAKLDEESEEVAHEIAADVERRRRRLSPPKPSVGLRMARDRMRARGVKA